MIKNIICDSREQRPILIPQICSVHKLCVGDYTSLDLEGIYHIERKSGADLYQSLLSGHVRFRNMFLRAKEEGIKVDLFIECSEGDFLKKRFEGSHKCTKSSRTVLSILSTMSSKYDFGIVWCEDRDDMAKKVLCAFSQKREAQFEADQKEKV